MPAAGELLAEALPGTHVFKAFNTVGVQQLEVRGCHTPSYPAACARALVCMPAAACAASGRRGPPAANPAPPSWQAPEGYLIGGQQLTMLYAGCAEGKDIVEQVSTHCRTHS